MLGMDMGTGGYGMALGTLRIQRPCPSGLTSDINSSIDRISLIMPLAFHLRPSPEDALAPVPQIPMKTWCAPLVLRFCSWACSVDASA